VLRRAKKGRELYGLRGLASTLTLLVPQIRADDTDDAITANDLAVAADLLDGGTDFHENLNTKSMT
jgi:hypothetical protein